MHKDKENENAISLKENTGEILGSKKDPGSIFPISIFLCILRLK